MKHFRRSATAKFLGFLLLVLTGMFPLAGEARAAEDFIEGNYWALIIGIDKYSALTTAREKTRLDTEKAKVDAAKQGK